MKKLKLFFACLLMAVLSIGQMWGALPANPTWTATAFASIPDGSTVIILNNFGTAIPNADATSAGPGKVAASYNSTTKAITVSTTGKALSDIVWTAKKTTNGVQFFVYESTTKYLGITSAGNSNIRVNASATYKEMVMGSNGNLMKPYDLARYIGEYVNGSDWRSYNAEDASNYKSGTTVQSLTFYVLDAVPSCTSEITITKADDPANGTFALDNSGTVCIDEGNATVNVTATPADHYHLASVTTTGSVGTIGTISGNTCEITDIDADTEIGVTFAEDTKYQVTWNVNGNEDTKTNVYAGEKPVFPATPAACDATSTTFYGWATAPWTGKLSDLSEKTVYTSASAMPDVNGVVTYYAVFAKMTGSASVAHTLTISGKTADTNYGSHSETDDKDATWSGEYNYGDATHIGLNKKAANHYLGSPLFDANVTSVKATIKNGSSSARSAYLRSDNETAQPSSGDLGSVSVPANSEQELTFTLEETAFKQFYVYVSDPLQFHEFIVTLEGSATYSDYMTTCCTQYNVNIADGIENGSVSADPTAACEGATVTLTFTPALNYHLSAWTLNGAAQDIADNTFEMPGADVTVSATFDQDACEPLGTPSVTVSGKDYPYDAVQLAWTAIEHADAYKVYIYDNEDNELEHNDAFAGVEYTIGQTLSASTTYKYSVQAISNTPATYCPSVAAAGTFETDALPTAHLTLIALGEEHTSSGDYAILTPFNLPTTAATCSKTFVGWDADADCAAAPTYAKGAEFQFNDENDVTLYAVYATETPGAVTLTKLGSGATFADGDKLVIAAKGTNFGLYFENAGGAYIKNWEFEGDDPVLSELTDSKKILTLVKSGDNWKFGDATNGYFYSSSSNSLEISTTNSSEFNSFSWNTTESAFTITKTDGRYLNCRTDLTSTNANLWRFNGTNTNAGSPFLNVYKYGTSASTYSNYSTECAAPLADPIFNVDPAEGPFATAQSIELSAAEGTIYYTTNGEDPTSASTEYTDPIVLDACGSTTIKAIAISATNQSGIASATYEIALPIPSVSAEDPYTEAEAVAVYNSGCYNNEDVWVTGTVQTAQFFSSKTYTITLTNGFKFYYFYDLNGAEYTSDYIEAGDVLVAKGKLDKYNTTYQLAQGCYLVSRTPVASKTSIANDIDHPYTVAEAIAFCNDPITYDLNDNVYVQGIAAGAPNSNGTFNIYDEGEETTLFQLYKSNLGTYDDIKALDVVTAYGKILKFSTTVYEMNQGAIVAVTPYVAPVVDVTGVELDETAITLKEGLSTTLVATVNPNDASNKNVTWESSNPAVASVANGVVTAETVGTATITVTTEDGGFTATCAVTVIDASARALPNAVFQKVTATGDITDGKYLIVYEGESSLVAFDGALETLDAVGNNIAVTVEGGYIIAPADAAFTIDITARTLKSYSGKYIGVTSNSNGLKQEDASTNYFNTYAIDANENAVITADFSGTTMTLRFNKASNQDRFRYYKNAGQENIQLYKMLEPENVRENLTDGKWGTICPAQTVMLPTGASFYAIAYVEKHGNEPYKVFYDEIAEGESLTAGQPYIFIAEGEAIKGVKVGDAATEGINDHGFIGKVEQYDFQVAAEDVANYRYYMVKDNSIRLCGEGWFRVGAERAYLDMSAGVNTVAHAPAAGRRRVCLTNQEAQVATGMDALNASETPVKMMIDGQLFILRGEKMYNANGQLVK